MSEKVTDFIPGPGRDDRACFRRTHTFDGRDYAIVRAALRNYIQALEGVIDAGLVPDEARAGMRSQRDGAWALLQALEASTPKPPEN